MDIHAALLCITTIICNLNTAFCVFFHSSAVSYYFLTSDNNIWLLLKVTEKFFCVYKFQIKKFRKPGLQGLQNTHKRLVTCWNAASAKDTVTLISFYIIFLLYTILYSIYSVLYIISVSFVFCFFSEYSVLYIISVSFVFCFSPIIFYPYVPIIYQN